MEKLISIVLDCGATNVRAVAISTSGQVLAKESLPNHPKPDPFWPGGLIWDVEDIWQKLVKVTRSVVDQIDKNKIAVLTVDTFGVDGAPVKRNGELLYPVISWACQRTAPIMKNIAKYIDPLKLFKITGLYAFNFNTINKIIWFKENYPELLEKMDYFAFISAILVHRLTGSWISESTMAGTSMLTDLKARTFSDEIFKALNVNNKFPSVVEPGTMVGKVRRDVAKAMGVPVGLPVVATGHDTQFAVYGSGAEKNQPVLSSGTWEILMVRTSTVVNDEFAFKNNVTIEWDAQPGLFNAGVQWLASGILEWIKNQFYAKEIDRKDIYELMIREAEQIKNSSVRFNIDFLNRNGAIQGLGLNTTRQEIYRAALEALAGKTKEGLAVLEKVAGFKAESVIVVGGGSRNKLWNKMRANILDIPIKVVRQPETTVMGAAMFAFAGMGIFPSPEDAKKEMAPAVMTILPEKAKNFIN